ncbi:SpaH/EbpB family LPXTG-anchored major pilin [Propionimicrobium lymphophilum]|uniref:SpaH/EbpB family LPXTG-anchored major pilin n=1 Tax=Propionimicrobium lymphophilum TaxID=33012 RepID=UPI0004197408|nr:SpaH/EbpB family LPXTG-anchored major pilin [Propionimicrobium lymphophilum]
MAKKSFRKLLAAACALTLMGGLGSAVNANAADKAPWAEGAPTTGSITITKTDDSKDPAEPVKGAEFTVTPVTKIDNVDLNLKTYDGWVAVAKQVKTLNDNPNSDTVTLGTAVTSPLTGEDGKATFSNLPIGLYKVEETKVPAGYFSDVKPFFMTIPEITGDNSGNMICNYNVNVDPKNKLVKGSIIKTGHYEATVGGDDMISYTIESTLNKKGAGLKAADIKGYAIFDDAQTNAYKTIDASAVKEVKIENGDTLKVDTDYTVGVKVDPDRNVYPAGERTRVQINFTDAGLTKIAKASTDAAAPKVIVNLTFDLKAGNEIPDSVTNKFGFVPGIGDNEPTPDPIIPNPNNPTPTPDPNDPNPTLKFRQFQIVKTNSVDNKALKDAEFIAFADPTKAKECVKKDDRSSCDGASVGYGTKKTDDDGKTDPYKAKVGATFYVVEKKAPSGYILSNKVTEVTIEDGSDVLKIGITNVPIKPSEPGSWFNLPRTGAIGVGIFALLGAGLVAGGTAMHMRSRRRENA